MSLKYTQGPVRIIGQALVARSVGGCQHQEADFMLAQIRGWGHLQYLSDGEEIQDGNLRRLAAAWNACTGIPTETLEKLQDGELAALLGIKGE